MFELAKQIQELDLVRQVLLVAGGALVVAGFALYIVVLVLKKTR